jgi:hypothetical protein
MAANGLPVLVVSWRRGAGARAAALLRRIALPLLLYYELVVEVRIQRQVQVLSILAQVIRARFQSNSCVLEAVSQKKVHVQMTRGRSTRQWRCPDGVPVQKPSRSRACCRILSCC